MKKDLVKLFAEMNITITEDKLQQLIEAAVKEMNERIAKVVSKQQ